MFQPGDSLRQSELAATLKRIAKNGATSFYRGEIAHVLVDDVSRLGGLITLDDLAKYQPKVRHIDRKSTRLNSSHSQISYAVFCLKKKTNDPLASVPLVT